MAAIYDSVERASLVARAWPTGRSAGRWACSAGCQRVVRGVDPSAPGSRLDLPRGPSLAHFIRAPAQEFAGVPRAVRCDQQQTVAVEVAERCSLSDAGPPRRPCQPADHQLSHPSCLVHQPRKTPRRRGSGSAEYLDAEAASPTWAAADGHVFRGVFAPCARAGGPVTADPVDAADRVSRPYRRRTRSPLEPEVPGVSLPLPLKLKTMPPLPQPAAP